MIDHEKSKQHNEELSNYEEWRSYPPVPEVHINYRNNKEDGKNNSNADKFFK